MQGGKDRTEIEKGEKRRSGKQQKEKRKKDGFSFSDGIPTRQERKEQIKKGGTEKRSQARIGIEHEGGENPEGKGVKRA